MPLLRTAVFGVILLFLSIVWPAAAQSGWSSDLDGDGDVDLTDFGQFQACFNGPNRVYSALPTCPMADFDGDGDVDLADFGTFAGCFNGPNRTPACAADPIPAGMVLIPVGEFAMGDTFSDGDSDERPVHAVYVDAFAIDQYEVTNQQYADGLNWARAQGNLISVSSGRVYKFNTGVIYPYCDTTTSSSFSRITWNGSAFSVVPGRELHPVTMVSWYGAVAFATWRSAVQERPLGYDLATWECQWNEGYRLPTEAEWEKAARGGVAGHRFAWSHTDSIEHAQANYFSSTTYYYDTSPTLGYHPLFAVGMFPYTSPAGVFAPNDHNIYDMTGNVWEWCHDRYSSTYYDVSPEENPRGPTVGTTRVYRGGCWSGSAFLARVANRASDTPANRYYYLGFRCAVGLP